MVVSSDTSKWYVVHCHSGFEKKVVESIKDELKNGTLVPLPLDNNAALRKALLYLSFEDGDTLGPAARAFIGELRYQTMNLPSSDFMLDSCTE